nr:hypothetical protein [Tanacetum cinerariifolium]
MVMTLDKGEHNTDFHHMVDFLEASPLRYALTVKPTVYVSHLRQFWSTARIETMEDETKILASVDGIVRTVSESSLRHNLKLRDEEQISSLSNAKLFENLTLMGYNISPNQKFNISPNQKRTRIAQSSIPPTIADEPTSLQRDVSKGEAYPIDSSFIADLDRATMAKSFTLPYDSAPRVTSPTADEGSMQLNITELTVLCTSLQRQHSELLAKFQAQEEEILKLKERVKVLEDREGVAATRSRDDASIKGRRGIDDVPTGSGSIPTASPPTADIPTGSDVVPTASLVFSTATVVTLYSRRKGKEVIVESDTPKKQILQEQIDTQVTKELEEQQEREDKRINNEAIAKYLQEYQQFAAELPLERRIELISDLVKYQENYAKIYKFQSQQRKSWTKKQKRDYYMAVIINNLGWKVKDIKKGIRSDQESSKKLKSSEEVAKETKSTAKIPEEKIKEMMQLIPIEELWDLVKEYLSIRPALSDKEMEVWVELKRMYEPDPEDQFDYQRQRDLHASREELSSEEGSSPCNDLLQASSTKLFTDGK